MTVADETFLDLALSRSTIDRSAAVRLDDQALALALDDPATKVLPLRGAAAPVRRHGGRVSLALRAPTAQDDGAEPWLLGVSQGIAHLAVQESIETPAGEGADAASDEQSPEAAVIWQSLREVGADLDDADAGLLTAATALAEWHRRHGHCPRCGAVTEVVQAGWVRRCSADGTEHHPRTDPAVIVAVTDADDRLLLGTGLPWPEGRVSVLAGFVEAGESLEAAVVREIQEEVGLVVEDLRYRGNQPWPFPASLMFAFRARARRTELVIQESELRGAGWYTREQLAGGIAEGSLTLPSPVSIARRLIEEWYGSPLPGGGAVSPR